jgi:hypothetical protein
MKCKFQIVDVFAKKLPKSALCSADYGNTYIIQEAKQMKCACRLPLKLVKQGHAVISKDSYVFTKHLRHEVTRRQGCELVQ